MRTKAEFTDLFARLGVRNPEQWASAEVGEDLGNLPRVAFLHQAWQEIPSEGDSEWLDSWMQHARGQPAEAKIVAAFDRMLALGTRKEEVVLLARGFLSQFLHRLTYLLDDPSIEDEVVKAAVSWGLYEETEDMEPVRRLGCIHELVFSAEPKRSGA